MFSWKASTALSSGTASQHLTKSYVLVTPYPQVIVEELEGLSLLEMTEYRTF